MPDHMGLAADTGIALTGPQALIHSGFYPYESLQPLEVLPIERGSQGGFHVMLAAKVAGIEPGSPTLELALQNDDLPMVTWEVESPDCLLSQETPKRALADHSDATGILLTPQLVVLRYFEDLPSRGIQAFVREHALQRMPVTVRVTVEDSLGSVATDSTEIYLDFPPPGLPDTY